MNKTGWDNKDIYDIGTGIANIWLILSCLIVAPYLIAPFLGGKFLPMALIKYGMWICDALVMKYVMKYVREKTRMKKQKWYFLSLWVVLSFIAWFPKYIGLIISVLCVIILISTFRSQGRAGWADEQ
jgi:hypothetical protein